MSSITGENLDCVEVAVLRLTDELKTLFMPRVEVIPKPAEGFGETVITTRRGVHVVVDDKRIYVRGKKNFSATWEEVPLFVACLRGALVPEYRKEKVEPDLEATSLEMASSWGPAEDPVAEIIFTADDAEDITKDYTLAKACPDDRIASEIRHVQKIGARKLFRYIEQIVW